MLKVNKSKINNKNGGYIEIEDVLYFEFEELTADIRATIKAISLLHHTGGVDFSDFE